MEKTEIEEAVNQIHRVLLGMNAFGSLELRDLNIIEKLLKKSFGMDLQDNE